MELVAAMSASLVSISVQPSIPDGSTTIFARRKLYRDKTCSLYSIDQYQQICHIYQYNKNACLYFLKVYHCTVGTLYSVKKYRYVKYVAYSILRCQMLSGDKHPCMYTVVRRYR